MKYKRVLLSFAAAVGLFLAACSGEVNGAPMPHPEPDSSVQSGRGLLASYGCGSCHSIPGVPGANGMTASPLDRFYERTYIAGTLPNTEETLMQWIQDPQKIVPGNAMPNLGATKDQARDIAAYLYHQPNLSDWINR